MLVQFTDRWHLRVRLSHLCQLNVSELLPDAARAQEQYKTDSSGTCNRYFHTRFLVPKQLEELSLSCLKSCQDQGNNERNRGARWEADMATQVLPEGSAVYGTVPPHLLSEKSSIPRHVRHISKVSSASSEQLCPAVYVGFRASWVSGYHQSYSIAQAVNVSLSHEPCHMNGKTFNLMTMALWEPCVRFGGQLFRSGFSDCSRSVACLLMVWLSRKYFLNLLSRKLLILAMCSYSVSLWCT